jgi:small-conductance mechanosensitive channel
MSDDFINGFSPWLVVVTGTVAVALALYSVRIILLRRIRQVTDRSRYTLDTVIAQALALPLSILTILATALACHWLLFYTEILADKSPGLMQSLMQILTVGAVLVFVDRLVSGMVGGYSEKFDTLRTSRSLIQVITRGVIITIGLLIILGTLGVSITPLIASLGITSLAVALALQPTLENVFSGIQLVTDKPIRVGDFIELESGEQGFVEKIGWRSTWVRMLQNNTVILPNSVLAQSKIINYFYPEKELSVPVEVGVHYSSDLKHVERVTLEVAREILISHEWGVDDYKTFVVYTSFGDSSINFTVMLRAKEYFNRFWVRSAFIKALNERYSAEGIVIPFPIRAINTDQESARIPTPNSTE